MVGPSDTSRIRDFPLCHAALSQFRNTIEGRFHRNAWERTQEHHETERNYETGAFGVVRFQSHQIKLADPTDSFDDKSGRKEYPN